MCDIYWIEVNMWTFSEIGENANMGDIAEI